MKKLFRLLFVAAMFLSGCNSGNGNGSTKIPEGYTLSNSWPTSVINLFLGEGRATVPDAGVSSVLYCVYDKTDTNCASIDIMIAGNYESTYIDILKNANWVVSNTKVEKIGYECNDVNQTVEVDVLYIEDYKYTYIDIYRYEDVKEYDPVAGLTPSTIWPAQQISDFLDSETVVPAAEVKNTCFYGEFDGEDSFFRVAVEGDQLVSYSSTLLFNGYSVDVEDELLFSDEDETIEISLKKVQGYTYIDICDVGSIESSNWPTAIIDAFLGVEGVVPAATLDEVEYTECEATGEYCAYIEIIAEGNLESSYSATLSNAGWDVDDETYYDEYGICAIDPNLITEVDFFYEEGDTYFYIYRYEDLYGGGGETSNYGTAENPLTVTKALALAESECLTAGSFTKEAVYAYGEVGSFENNGDNYKNVVICDLSNSVSISYLVNLDEYEMAEGDIIEIYGYMSFNGTSFIFTTNGTNDVSIVDYENGGGGEEDYTYGPWPTSLINTFLGSVDVVPVATTDNVYYLESEADDDYAACFQIVAEGDFETSYATTLSNAGWDVDDETYYDTYGICCIDPDEITEVDFFAYEGDTYFYIYRYEDLYGGGGDTSDYGTLENPLTVTEALAVAAIECTENYSITNEPIYCYGEVTSFETSTKSYKNVYITDGDNTVHIYTLGYYDGYEMAEGDIIEIYGYMKNYSGELQFATNNSTSTPTYVEIVDYENGGGGEEDYTYGPWPTSLINSFLGTNNVVPAATTDDVYYLESEADDDYAACFQIVVEGDLETSYATTLSNAGWDVDDETYYDTYGICCIDPDEITEVDFFAYEGDTYFYIYRYEDLYGGGGDTSNYGTLENPLTVTEALEVAGDECSEDFSYTAEPIYCYGEVQEFSDGGTYYKNVYISDGTNEVMIYKLDFLSGYNMMVGDIIEIYGYMKNYQGTLEFAPNGETTVTIVDYDDGEDDYEYGPWPTSLIEDLVGGSDIVPAATTDDVSYDFFEADEAHSAFVEIICDGNLEDSYKALLEEANWTIDDSSYDLYGYFAYDANEKAYIQFFFYEDETCFFIYNYDDVAGGGDSGEYVTEWPGDAIVEFLGSEASTVPSFEANEYYVEEFEEDETYAACLMICCEEDVSSDYFTTIKDLSWTYWTSQDEGYTAEDPDHTVFLQFGFDEEYGFCLYIYRWSDVKEETDITTTYGTVSNSLITTGDCLNVAAFSIKDGTGYTDYTAKIGNNEYKAYAYSTDDFIQIKSKTLDSGVVTTKSSGNVASVSIDWNSKSVKDNNSYATIEIYASNTAFSYEDMFDEDTSACVKVATLVCSTSCTFVFNTDANYQYIGIRSVEGAAYINNIYIQYK